MSVGASDAGIYVGQSVNIMVKNNLCNFAPPGNIAETVPTGTGIMVLAASDVENYNNRIINNKTIGTTIVSYFITELPVTDTLYNPYTSAIHIHDNFYKRRHQIPTLKHEMGILFFLKFGRDVPDLIYDSMPDPKFTNSNGEICAEWNLCIQNNSNANFLNLQIDKNFEKWYSPFFTQFSQDISPYSCELHTPRQALISQ